MKRILLAVAATLSIYACSPNDPPDPNNPNPTTPPADPTVMFSTFTYTMNGQTYTRVEKIRNHSTVAYDLNDTFDRLLNIASTTGNGPEFSARFSIPVLRGGTQVFDTLNMVRPIKGNGHYSAHLAMNFTIVTEDTMFLPNQDDDDIRPGHIVSYTSLQDIGDVTDSVEVEKGPSTGRFVYGTWDVWQASGTFTDTVSAAVKESGIWHLVDKEYPVTGTFTVRFLKMQ